MGELTHHHAEDGTMSTTMTVDMNSLAHASMGSDGQIILTGEDGHAYPVTVSGMISVPCNQTMYQTMVANIGQFTQIQNQNNEQGSIQVIERGFLLGLYVCHGLSALYMVTSCWSQAHVCYVVIT